LPDSAQKLRCVKKTEIEPTSPFCFDGTVWKPLHFPSSDQTWKPGVLWQTIRLEDDAYGYVMRNKGDVDRPLVELAIFGRNPLGEKTAEEIANEVRWRYDLDSQGVAKFVRKFRSDGLLGPVIKRWRGTRPKSGYSLYEYLVITVMLQNTMVRRSVHMLQSLLETYGQRVEFDGMKLWSFWRPDAIHQASEEELRRLRVGYRARTLRRQAAQFVSGDIDQAELSRLKGEALLRRLDEIYGVGPQSASYLSSEFFHDYDMIKSVSPWDAKIYSHLLFGHGRASPGRILEFLGANYSGFRTLTIEYLMTDIAWENREHGVKWLQKLVRL
jgi:3-methyladenine DNA glycosylase/8-oxoguanine DNA glycosylase